MRASLGANLTCSAPEEALYRVTDSSTPPLTHSHTHSPSEGPSTPPAANVSKLFHREGMQCTPQRTSERETPYLSTCRSPADCWRGTTVSCLPPERSRPSPPPPPALRLSARCDSHYSAGLGRVCACRGRRLLKGNWFTNSRSAPPKNMTILTNCKSLRPSLRPSVRLTADK